MKVFTAKDLVKRDFQPFLVGQHKYTEGPKYRLTLQWNLCVRVKYDLGRHQFHDERGNVWLVIDGTHIMAMNGYATDGCSPKTKLGSLWLGTPDFAWTRIASTIHDACFQFSHVPCFPLTRHESDWLFYDLMIMDIARMKVPNAWWARQIAGGYRNTVMALGTPFYHLGTLTKGRTGQCFIHKPQTEMKHP
jgi:hypothetical protein